MGKHSHNREPSGLGFGSGSHRPVKRRLPKKSRASRASIVRRIPLGGTRERISDSNARRRGPLETAPQRLKAEVDRRKARNRRLAMLTAVAAACVVVLSAVGVFAYAKHLEAKMQKSVAAGADLDLDLKKAGPQEPFNMLLLGFDKRSKDKVYRSDTVILAHVDPTTKEVWLLSIPRDTKVEIPGHGARKMNDAYALGGEELAIKTVERFTGVEINHFMGINFKGFNKAVDAMGGVWVDVPVEIDDPQADATPGDKASHISPGYQLLDGAHALTFVRTRHTFVDQDFGRMRNQQTFFMAVADQIATKTPVSKLPGIVTAMAPYISTDMSIVEMLKLAQTLKGAGSERVYTETIGGDWVSPYVVTDEDLKDELLAKMEAGKPFKEPEPESDEESATASADGEDTSIAPDDISVTIRNGAGISGCAKQAASVLKARAFEVVDVANADQFVYDDTQVVYKSDREAAALVAAALPPGAKLVESRGMHSFQSDVLVVVGKDWDIAKVPVAPIETN